MTDVLTTINPLAARSNRGIAEWVWYAIALLFILICAAPNLFFPFVADQIVALSGAKTIAEGGTLYVDFWDNKMPGLFWFYYVAGELFGYSEFGVHLLELIWMGVFSGVLMVTLRSYFFYPWMSAVAPITVVAVYYVSAESFLLTQLEILIALPVFLSAWFASRLPSSLKALPWLGFASGVCAGITVVFKLVFAPLFVVFWLVVSVHALSTGRARFGAIVTDIWVPVSLGVAAVLGIVAVKFWLDGALGELLWTAFEYPPQALAAIPPAPYYRLLEAVRFFLTYYLPLSGFIVVAIVHWWRSERDLFTSLLITWLVVGLCLILIQRFSWWQYHFLILFAPAGILGVRGIDSLMRHLLVPSRSGGPSSMVLAILLIIPVIGAVAIPGGQKVTPYLKVFVERRGDVLGFQKTISATYATVYRSTRFLLDKTALPGRIYVLGDPLYYHLSDRRPALPIIGWPWGYFLQAQWDRVAGQLDAARPPYIYVDKKNRKMIEVRGGGVDEFIDEHYIKLFDDDDGSWFLLKPKHRRKAATGTG